MDIIFEKKSNYTVEVTKEKLVESLKEHGFGVLWELNFKDKLKEKGFDYAYDFWVMEACNPGKAFKVLENIQKAGYFLPCKVCVYENESGVMAGLMLPSAIMSSNTEFNAIEDVAMSVEVALKEAVTKATQ